MLMFRAIAAAVTASTVAMVLVATGSGRSTVPVTLQGTVGPGFTIKLTKAGKTIKALKPGSYKFVINDRSSEHNFVLQRVGGGTAQQITTVPFAGTRTVTIKLTRGAWRFYCEPHASMMFGRFAVGQTAVLAATISTTTSTTTTTDDHGGQLEPGDDHGGDGEPEPSDDHGGN
jgi:plastocyanin